MSKRANENEVAELLRLIAQRPDHRPVRKEGDVPGDFDAWFDGGALRYVTGHTDYVFTGGASARVTTSPLFLSITLRFADGRTVTISQT